MDASGTGAQALFKGRQQQLNLDALADQPVTGAIAQSRYDKAFRIDSNGPTKTWRLFTVLAPGERPTVSANFTDTSAVVTVNGREFAFRRSDDGSYRYAGGELTPAR